MSRIGKVPWQNIVGLFDKKRRLHLCQTSDGLYGCPVLHCEHAAFHSERGCRKHVAKNHAFSLARIILRMSPIWETTGERYADVIWYRTNPNDF